MGDKQFLGGIFFLVKAVSSHFRKMAVLNARKVLQMSGDEALNRFGDVLDFFFPAGSGGPSWAQTPYTEDLDAAVDVLKDCGVTYEQLGTYVRSSWDIARGPRLGTSQRMSLTELLERAEKRFSQ